MKTNELTFNQERRERSKTTFSANFLDDIANDIQHLKLMGASVVRSGPDLTIDSLNQIKIYSRWTASKMIAEAAASPLREYFTTDDVLLWMQLNNVAENAGKA